MTKVISFKARGQCCGNCQYYVPELNKNKFFVDGFPEKNCNHSDRVENYYISVNLIEELNLSREPEDWCPKYKQKF